MERVLEEIDSALKGTCGVPRDAKIIVALSGGPDSVFLFDVLIRLAREFGRDFELCAAHLDHGLRGEESRQDREFVADLCSKSDVPLAVESIDLKSLRRPGESLEQAARRVRYAFLEEAALKTRAKWVTTGHTADDQAETLLLRIGRGTGIEGLRGIIPARPALPNSPVMLVRPLLNVTHAQIIQYLENRSIQWRIDSTNADTRFARNRARMSLSALSRQDAGRLRAALCSAASCALRDWEKIQRAAAAALDPAARDANSGMEIDLSLLDSSEEIVPYVAREMIKRAAGDLRRITATHVHRLVDLVSPGATVGRVDLPGGIAAVREYNMLKIGRLSEDPAKTNEIALPVPGEAALPDGTVIKAELANGDCLGEVERSACDPTIEYVDREKVTPELTIRCRRPGDRFQPLGLKGEKKLKDFLADIKVPRSKRDLIPIVTAGNEIVWVAGCRLDERYKLQASTRAAVRLNWLQGETSVRQT